MKMFAENFKLDKIELTSANGKVVGLGQQLLSMRIQEDITTSFIAAEVDLVDGIGLLQSFPIIGEEVLSIAFSVLSNDKLNANDTTQLKYEFYVYAVKDIGYTETASGAAYTLQAISKEAILNASLLTEKAYTSTYDVMVKDVMTSLIGTKKPVASIPALGVQNIVLPNMKPFQAIDMLRKRATSTKYPHSPFLFFETRNGFVFKDILSIFEEGKKKPITDITYKFQNYQAAFQDTSNDYRSLIAFSSPEKNDTFAKINNGAFSNKITTFDLITKTKTTYDFDLSKKMKKFDTFNKAMPHTETFVKQLSQAPARTYFVPVDSTKPNVFVDRFGERISYTNLIFQHFARAEMNASPHLEAGQVLYLDMKADLPNNERGVDTSQSGYYMIKSITHEIHITNGVPAHRAGCDLIRGSALEKLR